MIDIEMADKLAIKPADVAKHLAAFQEKMIAAQGDLVAVEKKKAQTLRYAFTSGADVSMAVSAVLAKHGLMVMESETRIVNQDTYETKGGSVMHRTTTCTETKVGDGLFYVRGTGIGCGSDVAEKSPMKSQTSSYKYSLLSALNIGMGDDPEKDQEDEPAPPKPFDSAQPHLVQYGKHAGAPLAKSSNVEWLKKYLSAIEPLPNVAGHRQMVLDQITMAENDDVPK